METIDNVDQIEPQKVNRPLGVWILTIWDGLFAGLIPLVSVFVMYFNEEAQAELDLSLLWLAASVMVAGLVIVNAVGAWRSNNIARIGLLILVALHYGLIAFNNATYANAGVLSDTMEIKAWARAFRSIIWIGVNAWYFLGETPKGVL